MLLVLFLVHVISSVPVSITHPVFSLSAYEYSFEYPTFGQRVTPGLTHSEYMMRNVVLMICEATLFLIALFTDAFPKLPRVFKIMVCS